MTLYLYAIARADGRDVELPAGIAGKTVDRIVSGPLCAFVSESEATAVRAERRHIAASQGVMRALQAEMDLLPIAFGTLTPSAEGVADLLERHRDELLAQLDRVKDAVEMGVKLNLEVADPIAYLVEHSAELRQARERTFGRRKMPSHDEKLRLGQMCETALRQFQDSRVAQLVALLTPSSRAISTLPIQGAKQIANLAVLVPRAGLGEFEAAVEAAAAEFEDDISFNLNGPWPPHNFVRLELNR